MCECKLDEIELITSAIEKIEGQESCSENTAAVGKLNKALELLRLRSDEAEETSIPDDENTTPAEVPKSLDQGIDVDDGPEYEDPDDPYGAGDNRKK